MNASIKEVVYAWLAERGGTIKFQKGPANRVRLEQILDLFAMLRANGYTDEEIKSETVKQNILLVCVNPSSTKSKTWKEMVLKDHALAVAEFFAGDVISARYDDSQFKERAVEVEAKQVESKAEPVKRREDGRIAEPIDMSVFKGVERPSVELDPEMAEFFGVKDE